MEKIKGTKILGIVFLSTIMVLTLVLGLMAVLRHNATVSSKVSFVATGVSGTITGTVKSPTTTGFVGTSAFDPENVVSSFNTTFSPRSGTSTWNIGHLEFLPDINGVTGAIAIEFTITNTGTNTILATIPPTYILSTETNLAQTYTSGEVNTDAALAFSAIQQQIESGKSWTFALNLSIINDALNFTVDSEDQITFAIKLQPSSDATQGEINTNGANINTASSIIPTTITEDKDYVAVLDFPLGYSLKDATISFGDRDLLATEYTWNKDTNTLTVPYSVIETLTEEQIADFSVTFNTYGFENAATADGSTMDNAFTITDSSQLGLLSDFVNHQNDTYAALNYKLTEDIDLNPNTTFTFIEDTGLVEITQHDGDENKSNPRTIYIGTGFAGETLEQNNNNQFDTEETASVAGTYYELLTAGYTEINQTDTTRFTNINNVITITKPGSATKDLVLNEWDPVGGVYYEGTFEVQKNLCFSGIFAGGGFNVYGIFKVDITQESMGLFGGQVEGCVENISVHNGLLMGYIWIGGICGTNYGVVQNCTSDIILVSATTGEWDATGGICGCNGYRENVGTITNCINYSTVLGAAKEVGGICGHTYGLKSLNGIGSQIIGCVNYGTVKSKIGTVAGISGKLSHSQNWCGFLENCANYGDIYALSSGVAGGIVASCNGSEDIDLKNCQNYGNVTANGNNAGGIVGEFASSYFDLEMINCSNFGDVSGKNCVGGLIGLISKSNLKNITNCYNYGNVTGTGAIGYVGGLIGVILSTSSLVTTINCTNIGTVSASSTVTYVGGICGANLNSSTFTNCLYKLGCATVNSTTQNGIGSSNNTAVADVTGQTGVITADIVRVVFDNPDSTDITTTVTTSTFLSAVDLEDGVGGVYRFVYDGSAWNLFVNDAKTSTVVTLSTYGINFTQTPVSGQTIAVFAYKI